MIIMMGVAGAGKSFQGRFVADKLGLPWLSTGEFLRMLVSGERRREMLAGKLLSDSEMIELADKIFHMIDTKQECILDGFPRTIGQAEWLVAQHKAGLINITMVIQLEASEEVVRARLLERGRPDDTPESIAERFREYSKTTLPIIKSMQQKGITVNHVDGEGAPEKVSEDITKLLEKLPLT